MKHALNIATACAAVAFVLFFLMFLRAEAQPVPTSTTSKTAGNPGGTGAPVGEVTCTSSSSSDAGSSVVPFNLSSSTIYSAQCNAAANFGPTAFCSGTHGNANFQPILQANTSLRFKTASTLPTVCCIAVSGDAGCEINPVNF